MVKDPYSGYSYKRKKFKKFRLFTYVVIALVIAFILLTTNIFFGFFKTSKPKGTLTLSEVNFWAEEIDSFTTKTNALQSSRISRNNGGAGYLVASNNWLVLESVYSNKPEKEKIRQFTCPSVNISLYAPEHAATVEKIISSFKSNFEVLCNQQSQYQASTLTADEISKNSYDNYNKLQILYNELNKLQESAQSPAYAKIMLYTNKHLLALYVLSTENTSSNFLSAIKHSACSIIFAYHDLIVDLKSNLYN